MTVPKKTPRGAVRIPSRTNPANGGGRGNLPVRRKRPKMPKLDDGKWG